MPRRDTTTPLSARQRQRLRDAVSVEDAIAALSESPTQQPTKGQPPRPLHIKLAVFAVVEFRKLRHGERARHALSDLWDEMQWHRIFSDEVVTKKRLRGIYDEAKVDMKSNPQAREMMDSMVKELLAATKEDGGRRSYFPVLENDKRPAESTPRPNLRHVVPGTAVLIQLPRDRGEFRHAPGANGRAIPTPPQCFALGIELKKLPEK